MYSTFPDEKSVLETGKKLLERKLIACFNTFEIRSGYWWEGKIVQNREWAVFVKTTKEKKKKLSEELRKIHPYEVPAIFTLKVESALPEYLEWLREVVL